MSQQSNVMYKLRIGQAHNVNTKNANEEQFWRGVQCSYLLEERRGIPRCVADSMHGQCHTDAWRVIPVIC